ncbi:MAG TPA: GntR family transcriptional regulator [Amaricoccus sp.]|nr:GntR family transcriptional regulator [Amaricoccus sp.]
MSDPDPDDEPSSAAPVEEMQRRPMGELAYAELKREIIDGDLVPASQWLEEELAVRLGMSRTPVREALVRLEQEGFVQITPRRGIRVRELTRRDVLEVNEVLECLELQAVQRLAARGLGAEEMNRLDSTIAGMDEALARDDVHAWARADYAFHRLIIELAGNRHLETVATTFLDKAHRFRVKTLELRTRPRKSTSSHAATVEAIRRMDAEMALDIHRLHKRRWAREVEALIERLGLPNGD